MSNAAPLPHIGLLLGAASAHQGGDPGPLPHIGLLLGAAAVNQGGDPAPLPHLGLLLGAASIAYLSGGIVLDDGAAEGSIASSGSILGDGVTLADGDASGSLAGLIANSSPPLVRRLESSIRIARTSASRSARLQSRNR